MTVVVGHQEQIKLFDDLLASGRLYGSWLLSGPKGVGKATFAYAFAERIYSKSREQLVSHGSFRVLERELTDEEKKKRQKLIEAGKELDPAEEAARKRKSNISVDDVRKIISFTGMRALSSEPKIVLIDSVDDLQAEGANALLKTLEEPPAHTLFLLVCHFPHRLLDTIRSRCRELIFPPLTDELVMSVVQDPLIAKLSEGCLGKAFQFKEYTDLIMNFEAALVEKDLKKTSGQIDQILKIDGGSFLLKSLILNYVHRLALFGDVKFLDFYVESEKIFNQAEYLYLDLKKIFINQIVKLWN